MFETMFAMMVLAKLLGVLIVVAVIAACSD